MTSEAFERAGHETRIYEVQKEFHVQSLPSHETVYFYEGEKILVSRSLGDSQAQIDFVPDAIAASYGETTQSIRVNSNEIPQEGLAAQGSGDRETLVRLSEQTDLEQKAEARVRRYGRAASAAQGSNSGSDPISDFFAGFGQQSSSAYDSSSYGRGRGSYSRGGRMVLRDSRGRYQASGCLAFVESHVGWAGGHVGNGVGMVSALVNRMNWHHTSCSPVHGTVASWSGGRHGAGHTAVYNANRGCWEYDRGCTGLRMTGFSLIGCASR